MPTSPPPTRVSQSEIRKLFNEHYLDGINSGRIHMKVMRGAGRHPSPPLAFEPYCTESQEIYYFDSETNQEIARAHRYLRPDGTLGASGLPDPKRVFLNGIWYRMVKTKNSP